MLAFIFRGFFLVGILSWYSTSVWKMIDVYFKDRFQSYLRAEYDKNPHMRADLEAYRATAGKESPTVPTTEPEKHLDEVIRVCTANVCPVSNEPELKAEELLSVDEETTTNDLSDVVQIVTTETTEFSLIISKNESTGTEEGQKVFSIEEQKNDSMKKENIGETKKTKRKTAANRVEKGKTTKKRLKTITLTEKDFASTRIKVTPQDFAEFDADEDLVEVEEDISASVLVSELPYKPKADIGDLRRVSPDEFCPMTLEDEVSCDEIKTWP